MAIQIGMRPIAYAAVASNGTTILERVGCQLVNIGAGQWTLTLPGGGLDQTECHIGICPRDAAIPNVVHTSDTSKAITLSDNTFTPLAVGFTMVVWGLDNM